MDGGEKVRCMRWESCLLWLAYESGIAGVKRPKRPGLSLAGARRGSSRRDADATS